MYYNTILVVLILILLFLWYHRAPTIKEPPQIAEIKENTDTAEVKGVEKENDIRVPGLTNGSDRLPDEDGSTEEDAANPHYNEYKDIPRQSGCSDEYTECAMWAANGECEANPDFMIQNCTNSCKSCGLNQEQKGTLVRYYFKEPLKKCIYRGSPYPPGLRLSVAISDLYR